MLIHNMPLHHNNFCNNNSWSLNSSNSKSYKISNNFNSLIFSNRCGSHLVPAPSLKRPATAPHPAWWPRTTTASLAVARSSRTRQVQRPVLSVPDFVAGGGILHIKFPNSKADKCSSSNSLFNNNSCCSNSNNINITWRCLRRRPLARTAIEARMEGTTVGIAVWAAEAAR